MLNLRTGCVRLGIVGRGALVGALIGMLATQAVAEDPIAAHSVPAHPDSAAAQSGSQANQVSPDATANLPLVSADSNPASLPDAPAVSVKSSESASLNLPPELRAMIDDAKQNAQNLQPAPAKKPHGVQRPGMLIMGIIGVPIAALGADITIRASKNRALAATAILAPGVAMTGFGFYFAFKPKQ